MNKHKKLIELIEHKYSFNRLTIPHRLYESHFMKLIFEVYKLEKKLKNNVYAPNSYFMKEYKHYILYAMNKKQQKIHTELFFDCWKKLME